MGAGLGSVSHLKDALAVELPDPERPWLLVVYDESEILSLLVRSLRDEHRLLGAPTGAEAGRLLDQQDVAVVITDQHMPLSNGLQALRETLLRRPDVRRILMTGYTDLLADLDVTRLPGAVGAQGSSGALDSRDQRRNFGDLVELRRFQVENRRLLQEVSELSEKLRERERILEQGLDERARALLTSNRELERQNTKLSEQARRDGLTGLYNPRTMTERLSEELARAHRSGTPLSLLYVDLDNFRIYNDLVGHERGDECLVHIAELLAGANDRGRARLRASDIVSRYGGEEFLILLPETDRSGARIKAERLREAIEQYPFPGAARLSQGHLTASIGVASYPLDAENGDELLARADEALLSAKRAGRNQVRIPSDKRSTPGGLAVREVGSYRRLLPVLGGHLRTEGALAALSVTLTQLARVEAEYGAHLSRQLLSQLEEAVLRAVGLFGETPVLGTCEDEARLSLLIFLPGRRTSRCPSTADLAALAERLEASLSHQLFRLEQLVHAPGRVVVGWGEGVYSSRLPVERLVAEVVTEAGESVARRLQQLQSQDRTLLRQLLVEEELSFRYQPIVRKDGTRFGVEALVRGPPDRGWDRPDHLFWRAAEVGLLDELDRGCALGALREAAGHLEPHEKLFINVLPSSLYDDAFVENELPQAVAQAGLTPARIVLEVTEQHAIESLAAFQESIRRVGNLGFQVALDDVGTGNSNLHALLEIRPGYVKLDRLLVDGISDNPLKQQLVAALLAAGKAMPAELIAEGIERPEDLAELRRQGIDLFQGYLFGRPVPFPGR